MSRENVLALSTVAAFLTLSGVAHAGPGITDRSYWPNEVGPSSYQRVLPTEPDQYRSRAMSTGRTWSGTQAAPEGSNGQPRCRYLGGPKYPTTC